MSTNTKIALGLTEFVSKLIEETFNAITLSAQEQAERDGKFAAAMKLELDEFIEKHISDVEIDLKLEELFPAQEKERPHAIYAGAPYSFDESTGIETPPVKSLLGLTLSENEFARGKLTDSGVDTIRAAAKILTGRSLYESFRKMVDRGIPRVVVDKGRILTRLTFETHETDNDAASGGEDTRSAPASGPATPRFMIKKSLSNVMNVSTANMKRLSSIRLAVAPVASEDAGADTRSSVYGEVEIQFRTVTD